MSMGDLVEQVRGLVKYQLSGIHTAFPGKIVSYDPAKNQAVILPKMKLKKPDGEMLDYPQLTGVPVVGIQTMGQKTIIALPIKAGDGCLVVCAEQALDQWQYERDTGTNLKFDLTNAIAIPGLFVDASPVVQEACSGEAVILDNQGIRAAIRKDSIELTADGTKMTIQGDGVTVIGNMRVQGKVTVTEDVEAAGVSLVNHTHADGSPPQ